MRARLTATTRTHVAVPELFERIASHGYHGDRSVLATVVAWGLAARIARALEDASTAHAVSAWVERTSAIATLDPKVTTMVRSSCSNVAALVRGKPSELEVLSAIERDIARVLLRHLHASAIEPAEACDDLEEVTAAFVLRLDESDPLSAEHSRAVSLWCRRLAVKMNLEKETVFRVARCGLLHDVGKSRTPGSILNAPRSLTEDEWAVMRDHTRQGAQMLEGAARLKQFAHAARSHHERLDGKGYPDRLEAREIPLDVRIVTVADSFNAMIGRRPYRLPLSPANALEQLMRHRETQFDPSVVDAMIDVIENPSAAREGTA